MIDATKYQEVLDTGLTLDHYHILAILREGGGLPDNKRVQGFINLLSKKGYIEEGALTEKAFELIESYVVTVTDCTTTAPEVSKEGKVDFGKWVKQLHEKCQEKLKVLTGSSQVRSKVNAKDRGYPFLCNVVDLGKVLYKVISMYKLKDLDAIERCILGHIENCHAGRNYFPLVRYYVMKDGMSNLVTDLENPAKKEITKSNNQTFL